MSRQSRIPLSQWRQHQVLRLAEPVNEIQEGWFVCLDRSTTHFRVSRLGEDEQGDLCQTDEVYEVHVDFAECFVPAVSIGQI
jgi:hypothetical protein